MSGRTRLTAAGCLAFAALAACAAAPPAPPPRPPDVPGRPLAARFPVVDFHQHTDDALTRPGDRIPDALLLRMMDAANVRTLVILTGGWGPDLQGLVDARVVKYPGRFVVFTQPDWSRVDAPDFGAQMAALVRDGVRRGARGLKVLKELGLDVRDAHGRLLAVDDPRLDPMWAECGRLGVPVALHAGDPAAFFEPLGPGNERAAELLRHPEWHRHGKGGPSLPALLEARDRVFARHPGTTFVALHVAGRPDDLDAVSRLLDRYPNVMVDLGARQNELGRQAERARRFFLEYQDRILFGTDRPLGRRARGAWTMEPGLRTYRSYFRWLETTDRSFPYDGHPRQGDWSIDGLGLPDAVLEKVYSRNADRILSPENGGR